MTYIVSKICSDVPCEMRIEVRRTCSKHGGTHSQPFLEASLLPQRSSASLLARRVQLSEKALRVQSSSCDHHVVQLSQHPTVASIKTLRRKTSIDVYFLKCFQCPMSDGRVIYSPSSSNRYFSIATKALTSRYPNA